MDSSREKKHPDDPTCKENTHRKVGKVIHYTTGKASLASSDFLYEFAKLWLLHKASQHHKEIKFSVSQKYIETLHTWHTSYKNIETALILLHLQHLPSCFHL